MDETVWSDYVKGLLKAELKRKNITYKQLVDKLAALGVSETEANIKNKVSRGGFSAVFLVQCLAAIGVQSVRLDDLPASQ
ncbi:hypothetical protein JDN40_00840 [Rhodomicrobium vannielii ATCC 17100]|uniref:DUF6471 domain-containing protein n=1 Tax=Rhodomicrobium vannielii TaxID=1069 RepID=UPI00191A2A72|nr:DUF6471 domain-containing protein [Rhodomicrobium vannielii]MBJ7532677.1 hypothetical protein [Rhodomicrobium vannielii ATCC 17100]